MLFKDLASEVSKEGITFTHLLTLSLSEVTKLNDNGLIYDGMKSRYILQKENDAEMNSVILVC